MGSELNGGAAGGQGFQRATCNIKEAARYLGVSERTVRRMVADGELDAAVVRLRGRVRFSAEVIYGMVPRRPPGEAVA